MPSGGTSDFVINATLDDYFNCTADKTYAQIQEAVQAGKKPVVYLDQVGTTITMPLVASGGFFGFAGSIMEMPPSSTQYVVSIQRNNEVVFAMGYGLGLGDDETLRQISMSKDPVQEMEIATKQYVDDGLAKKAPAGDYVTNSALNEKGYLTLDTLPKYGGETA